MNKTSNFHAILEDIEGFVGPRFLNGWIFDFFVRKISKSRENIFAASVETTAASIHSYINFSLAQEVFSSIKVVSVLLVWG